MGGNRREERASRIKETYYEKGEIEKRGKNPAIKGTHAWKRKKEEKGGLP